MRRAQSTLEYILMIGSLAAVLIIMGAYMKRGFQGNVRALSDQLGEQYSPGNMDIRISEATRIISSEDSESKSSRGSLTSSLSATAELKDTGRVTYEKVGALGREQH